MATTKATLLGHRSATSFSDLTLSGDLTVNGTTTTLDTAVQNVDKLEIGASSTDYGAKINQTSTGNILQLQDNGTDVMVVKDGGNVGIGTASPSCALHVHTDNSASTNYLAQRWGNSTTTHGYVDFQLVNPGSTASGFPRLDLEIGNSPIVSFVRGGNVGIGDTSPSEKLVVSDNTASQFASVIKNTHASGAGLKVFGATGTQYSFIVRDYTDNTNSLVVLGNGNVGIGTTSSFGGTSTHKYFSILNTDGTDNLDRPAVLELACSNKGNGVHVGKIDFWSDVDGGDDNVAAIICAQEGTTSNNVGGRFRFQTKADGGSLADSMVITDEGNVGIGLTTPDRELHVRQAVTGPQAQFDGGDSGTPLYTGATSNGRGEIQIGATGGYHGAIIYTDSGGTEMFIHNNYAGSTSARVTIRAGSSGGVHIARDATSWSSSSDERMKDIHSHITGGLEKLANVRTVIASFKKSPDKVEPMLIAQDFIDILPEAVSKDPPTEHDDDGTPEDGAYNLCYTSTIPLLVNAIQELSAKVTALENA